MQTALSRVALAYLAAWAAAWIAGLAASGSGWSPVAVAFVADVVATCVIFAFSLAHDNSSFYDPYWSVAPLPIAVYWAIDGAWANGARQALVLTAVAVWGVRLTYSWVRGWRGLAHEDWRYVDLRARTGRHYWPVSFVGLHLAPTLVVFLGLLSLRSALASPAPLGPLDAVAFAVTGAALWLEARADEELRRHRDAGPGAEEILRSGVWAWCRHPNYLGEMGFWWGLWLFGVAADASRLWTIVGPLTITAMFFGVSLPMMERRMRERRPGWDAHARACPLVIPSLSALRASGGRR